MVGCLSLRLESMATVSRITQTGGSSTQLVPAAAAFSRTTEAGVMFGGRTRFMNTSRAQRHLSDGTCHAAAMLVSLARSH